MILSCRMHDSVAKHLFHFSRSRLVIFSIGGGGVDMTPNYLFLVLLSIYVSARRTGASILCSVMVVRWLGLLVYMHYGDTLGWNGMGLRSGALFNVSAYIF